jgi:hypothetical protein
VRSPLRRTAVLAPLALVLLAAPAHGQWIAIGRKAVGKIKTMTQQEETGAAGYSVATVVLAGKPDKVFAAALKAVKDSPAVKLTQQDPSLGALEFVHEKQVIGLRISQVDSKLVQLLFASTVAPGAADAMPATVAATLRICKELGAKCEVVK